MLNSDVGVITLAIPKDYKKAIALALTLKEHTPNLPISIVCPSVLKEKLEPYFDKVIIEREDLKGFEHKLYLDEYSPYLKTFFFDADILVIKDITPILTKWSGSAYAVRGYLAKEGISEFGLDRKYVLESLEKEEFSVIDGAGHAYFEKPACNTLFNMARDVLSEYHIYKAKKFADEDAVGIAMTILKIPPKDETQFLGSPWCAINSSFRINTNNATCSYDDLLVGKVEPYVVHFPRFAYPVTYAREMLKVFKRHDIKISGVMSQAFKEYFVVHAYWPLLALRRKIIKLMS